MRIIARTHPLDHLQRRHWIACPEPHTLTGHRLRAAAIELHLFARGAQIP